jgi:hypothetical protein
MKTSLFDRLALPHREPWHSPTYLAGCFTWRVACDLSGDHRNVSRGDEIDRPPFCLRLRPAYRSPATRAFRATVAREARRRYRGNL